MPDIGHLFIHSATIQRTTHTADGRGGQTETLTTVASGVKCRRNPAMQKDMTSAGKLQAEVTHSLYTAPAVDVRVDDRVVIDGITYRVRVAGMVPSIAIYKKSLLQQISEA